MTVQIKPFLRVTSAQKKAAMERALAALKPDPLRLKPYRPTWIEKGFKAVKSAVKGARS